MLALFVVSVVSAAARDKIDPELRDKKVIMWGPIETPTQIAVRIKELQKIPIDGMVLTVTLTQGGNEHLVNWFNIWGGISWNRDDLKAELDVLKGIKFGRYTDNFFRYDVCSKEGPDWFNDQKWRTIIQKSRDYAWFAREGGLKGIFLDVEMYGSGGNGWNYPVCKQREKTTKSFIEYQGQARLRGRQIMEAFVSEYPDLTVILTYGNWTTRVDARAGKPAAEFREALITPFIDGLLEGCGPNVTLVDGHEDTYHVLLYETFRNIRAESRKQDLELTQVPDLYRKFMKVSFGNWISRHAHVEPGCEHGYEYARWQTNPERWELNYFSPERLEHAIYNALKVADKYVWIFGHVKEFRPQTENELGQAYLEALERAKLRHDIHWKPDLADKNRYPSPDRKVMASHWRKLLRTHDQILDLSKGWNFTITLADIGYLRGDEFWPRADWKPIRTDDYWQNQGYRTHGFAWYETKFVVPASAKGRKLLLTFGGVAGDRPVLIMSKDGGNIFKYLCHVGIGEPWQFDMTEYFNPDGPTLVYVRIPSRKGPAGIYNGVRLLSPKK